MQKTTTQLWLQLAGQLPHQVGDVHARGPDVALLPSFQTVRSHLRQELWITLLFPLLRQEALDQ